MWSGNSSDIDDSYGRENDIENSMEKNFTTQVNMKRYKFYAKQNAHFMILLIITNTAHSSHECHNSHLFMTSHAAFPA